MQENTIIYKKKQEEWMTKNTNPLFNNETRRT